MIGDTVQLSATLYINNAITNGTITWENTDMNVAAIDGTGKVTFLSDGSVSFKAYWVEKDISETSDIVIVGNPDISYTYKISGFYMAYCF
ncbi:MAG: Ig-like domain-containing protein [Eubacterium sp.]|nr:Ig-like domain-containing protein [Eubacterium sp.]